MNRWRVPYLAALVPILLAISLHLYEHVALSDNGFSPGFFLWSLLPYAVCIFGLALSWNPLSLAFAASVALAFDLLAHYSVFIHPTSSTAPLILLFMPIYNAVLWIPAAMLLAHLARRWLAGSARAP
ncbi:MAG TPA: hypothetical protein VJO12_14335 [Stellaceae bacterium]|nr:hypothetical protein [Stellaceae bacterium]